MTIKSAERDMETEHLGRALSTNTASFASGKFSNERSPVWLTLRKHGVIKVSLVGAGCLPSTFSHIRCGY